MAKNWRLAVCTRWRLLIFIGLIILGWFLLNLASYFMTEYQARRLEKKAKSLSVGMTVAELFKIMGPPAFKTHREREDNQELDDDNPVNIVKYTYWAVSLFYDSPFTLEGVYVNERSGKVIHLDIHKGLIHMSIGPSGVWRRFLVLTLMAILIWLFYRLWCKRSMKKLYARDREGPLP